MIKLTKEQIKHKQSIKWLFSGPHAVGKTFLLAFVFLEIANENKGCPIKIQDHNTHIYSNKYLIEEITCIFEESYDTENLELIVRKSDFSILIKEKENGKTS